MEPSKSPDKPPLRSPITHSVSAAFLGDRKKDFMKSFYQPLASLESCGDVKASLEPRTKLLSVRFFINAPDWSVIRQRQSARLRAVAAIWGLTFIGGFSFVLLYHVDKREEPEEEYLLSGCKWSSTEFNRFLFLRNEQITVGVESSNKIAHWEGLSIKVLNVWVWFECVWYFVVLSLFYDSISFRNAKHSKICFIAALTSDCKSLQYIEIMQHYQSIFFIV